MTRWFELFSQRFYEYIEKIHSDFSIEKLFGDIKSLVSCDSFSFWMYQLLAVAGGLVEPAVLMKLLVQYYSSCSKKVQYEGTCKKKLSINYFLTLFVQISLKPFGIR